MIIRIKFASVPVSDQDASLAFYTKKLGAVETDQPMGPGQRWIELSIPGAETRLVLFTIEEHRDRIGTFSNIVFRADDVDQTYEQLVEKGVEFIQPPKTESWGTSAIFQDPNGNQFVLSSK
jgi:predicted enzyme related to lactoylglutathione lyase